MLNVNKNSYSKINSFFSKLNNAITRKEVSEESFDFPQVKWNLDKLPEIPKLQPLTVLPELPSLPLLGPVSSADKVKDKALLEKSNNSQTVLPETNDKIKLPPLPKLPELLDQNEKDIKENKPTISSILNAKGKIDNNLINFLERETIMLSLNGDIIHLNSNCEFARY